MTATALPASMLKVRQEAAAPAGWDAFVRRQTGWTTFHLCGWANVVETVHGHRCWFLWAERAGVMVGILPLVELRSPVFGRFLVSMPFGSYGGPLGEPEATTALVDAAVALADRLRVDLLELRARCSLGVSLGVSHRKVVSLLDLPETPDALLKQFGTKLRAQVRRPLKDGVVVRIGADQCEPFFRVFAQHMRDLGTPTQPLALFTTIRDRLGDDARFACAWLGDTPIAAGAGFRFGHEFEITWASALRSHARLSANMAVYHALMNHAIAEGLRIFNFGRSTPGSGPHKYKQQWGVRDEPLWWYGHGRGAAPASTPSPQDGRFSWGPRVWRHLPAAMATWLGPRIVRYIP